VPRSKKASRRPAPWSAALWAALGLGLWTAAADVPAAPEGVLTGTTMRMTQEVDLGDLTYRGQFNVWCVAPRTFRVEGSMHFQTLDMTVRTTIVSKGHQLRQLSETPLGPRAVTLDLDRVREALPQYSPMRVYDPAAYKELLEAVPEKKGLGEKTMKGVRVEGYQVPVPKGLPGLPAGPSVGLPDPAVMRVWISPEDGVARKVELEDSQGRTFLKMTYAEVRRKVRIPAEKFDLEFPEGTVPTDVTDLILGAAAGAKGKSKHD